MVWLYGLVFTHSQKKEKAVTKVWRYGIVFTSKEKVEKVEKGDKVEKVVRTKLLRSEAVEHGRSKLDEGEGKKYPKIH